MQKEIARLRRGTGVIYLLAALLHAGEMSLAALYSSGRLHVFIPVALWRELYFAHFLFLILGGIVYLTLAFRQTGIFYYEVLADFLVGVAGFVVVLSAVAFQLAARRLNPWCALIPSGFLAAYGLGLRQGRAFGFGPKPVPLP